MGVSQFLIVQMVLNRTTLYKYQILQHKYINPIDYLRMKDNLNINICDSGSCSIMCPNSDLKLTMTKTVFKSSIHLVQTQIVP